MKILIDTNIALDVLMNRTEFFQASYDVIKLSAIEQASVFITTNSITDIFYILHKSSKDSATSKSAIAKLLKLVQLADVIATDITIALSSQITDFEDAVMCATAKRIKADYIVTRNAKDFTNSPVPAINPQDFLNKSY